MQFGVLVAVLAAILSWSGVACAETVRSEHGGDTFVAGETVTETLVSSGDAFVAGKSMRVSGNVQGDFHASGFDVLVDIDVGEDAYLAGATVTVRGAIGDDLSAMGYTIRTELSSRVGGNSRLMGSSVTLDGPIDGALSVTGKDVLLNAPISGDVRIVSKNLSFGSGASISGNLVYTTEEPINIPESVIAPSRVTYEELEATDIWNELDNIQDMPVVPSATSIIGGFLITLLFFVVIGAIALGFFPKRVSWLRKSIGNAPGRSLLLGVIGLSVLFGAIPVTGLTIIGLPFVPIALFIIVVVWTLAYALGAYAIAMRVMIGFGRSEDPSIAARLVVFAAAIIVVVLLNFIPFVGWVANYTLVLLGVGAMTHGLFLAIVPNADPTLNVDMEPV